MIIVYFNLENGPTLSITAITSDTIVLIDQLKGKEIIRRL